jgi:hypothetical protein
VIVIGIEVGLDNGPLVFNVVVPPETVADTKSELVCWENCRMVAALAGVASASEATHAAAKRISGERMVPILPW